MQRGAPSSCSSSSSFPGCSSAAPSTRRRSFLVVVLATLFVLCMSIHSCRGAPPTAEIKSRGITKKQLGGGDGKAKIAKALKRRRQKKAATGAGDEDAIPFLESTRFKTGSALTSKEGSFVRRIARTAGKSLVNSSMFRFIAEEKIFESVVGMLAWRVAFNWSKDPSSAKKARLLFTMYICLYLGALFYVRHCATLSDDTRTVKVSAMPQMLGSLLDMAKKMRKGEGGIGAGLANLNPKETEMTFKEYDLSQVKTAFDRFSMFLLGMTFLHFRMKNIYMIMYWGILGPIMMVREPIFQVYLFGMEETGIRERPFGPKEEPEEVEEPPADAGTETDGEEKEEAEEGSVTEKEREDEEEEEDVTVTSEEEGDDEEEEQAEEEEEEQEEEEEEDEEIEEAAEEEEEEEEEEVENDEEEEEEEDYEDAEEEAEEEEEEEDEGRLLGRNAEDEATEGDIASTTAHDEHPETFHVETQEEDIHPHHHKGAPEAPEKFKVEKQRADVSKGKKKGSSSTGASKAV